MTRLEAAGWAAALTAPIVLIGVLVALTIQHFDARTTLTILVSVLILSPWAVWLGLRCGGVEATITRDRGKEGD